MIAAVVPLLSAIRLRCLVDVVDLVDRDALVRQVQHLVVDVGVEVALSTQHLLHPVVAPARPVVRGDHHLGLLSVEVERLVDVLRPGERVAHHRAAQGVDVVEGSRDVLPGPEHLLLREPGVHLGRRLGAGRVLELHLHAVDRVDLDGLLDDESRRDQAEVASGDGHGQSLAGVPVGAGRQENAVLVEQPPTHGVAGVDVLGDRVLHEIARRDDLHLARPHVRLVHDAAHTAEVVAVGVRVDYRYDGQLTQMLVDELLGRPRRFQGGCGVEDDPAGLTPDEGDVGQVEAAYLVEARDHLVEPVVHVELRLAHE